DKAGFEVVEANKEKATFGPTQMYKGKIQGKVGEFRVNNTGQSDLFVNVFRSGIPEKSDTSAYTRTVGITRNIDKVTSNTFRQTQSYIVRLNIDSERALTNVILADLLPAGFEIENPRLLSNAATQNTEGGNVLRPSYLEMRDDRLIAAFDNLPRGTHTFSYVVRAVT
ncbi:TPA: hypothetical protein DDW35_13410, partial [Candidatus Sumerlaeota bacterium]|nr:hypothetical protein [Candidatus Sumerlaeota bacterium]